MVPEKSNRKNFIEKNIEACTNKVRINSENYTALRGFPVFLFQKEEEHRKNSGKPHRSSVSPPTYYIYSTDRFRTTVKVKEIWEKKKKEFHTKRVLSLPVTTLQVPESNTPDKLFAQKLFLQVAAGSSVNKGVPWETLHYYTSLQRLLTTMNSPGQTLQCSANTRTNTFHSQSNTFAKEGHTKPQESSYQEVLKKHVETLSNVVNQDQEEYINAKITKKPKKKAPTKLEIKIDGLNDNVNVIGKHFDELVLAEPVDNCGNLTPVITYNHVLSLNQTDGFQYGTSITPATSSKGSRSPSPLLEVPAPSSEISTKYPTV